jgi:hypothetical protein
MAYGVTGLSPYALLTTVALIGAADRGSASQLLADPGMRYQDLGPDYYERQRDVRRQVAHHAGKLGSLGFEVTLCRLPAPDPDGTGPIQAA